MQSMKLSDLFSNYFTVRNELVETVKRLTADQLKWVASDHPNSIGSLLGHIAETEYFWISVVARAEVKHAEADWNRFDGELSSGQLLNLLHDQELNVRSFLEERDISEWDSTFYNIEKRGEKVSLRWLAWHVVEHQARHRGQIFMLMRMQGLEVPHV